MNLAAAAGGTTGFVDPSLTIAPGVAWCGGGIDCAGVRWRSARIRRAAHARTAAEAATTSRATGRSAACARLREYRTATAGNKRRGHNRESVSCFCHHMLLGFAPRGNVTCGLRFLLEY